MTVFSRWLSAVRMHSWTQTFAGDIFVKSSTLTKVTRRYVGKENYVFVRRNLSSTVNPLLSPSGGVIYPKPLWGGLNKDGGLTS